MDGSMTKTQISMIPWSRIRPSPLNPRKHQDDAKLQELAASIEHDGILQNLVVRASPFGGGYEIAAGERRYLAFGLLVKAEKRNPEDELPCRIAQLSDLELKRISTTENVKRQDLTPLEEAEAFADMIRLGDTEENISASMGMALKTVQQRLVIARALAPEVRKAMEAGLVNLAQAQAFTIANPKQQAAVLKEMQGWAGRGNPINLDAPEIRHRLTLRQMPVRIAIFDKAFYKGEIINDLFDPKGEAGFFTDMEQAKKLQLEAVEAVRQKFLDDGWSWAEIHHGYFYEGNFQRSKDKAKAGVMIVVDNGLAVKVHVGLAKASRRQDDLGLGSGRAKKEKADRPPLTGQHMIWAAQERTRALQVGVSGNPDVAISLAIVGFMQGQMGQCWMEDIKVDTKSFAGAELQFTHPWLNRLLVKELAPLKKLMDYLPDDDERATNAVLKDDQRAEAFAILMRMNRGVRLDLFAAMIAARFGTWSCDGKNYGDSPLVLEVTKLFETKKEPVKFALDESYLQRLSRDQLRRVAHQAGIPAIETGAIVAKKRGAAIAELLAHPKLKTFMPPELGFFDEKTLRAALAVPKAPSRKKPAKKARRKS